MITAFLNFLQRPVVFVGLAIVSLALVIADTVLNGRDRRAGTKGQP